MSKEVEAPKVVFPCEYTIRIMGELTDNFQELMLEVVERHAPGVDRTRVTLRESRNGRYGSVMVVIVATGEQQLSALHHDLKATGLVQMVL